MRSLSATTVRLLALTSLTVGTLALSTAACQAQGATAAATRQHGVWRIKPTVTTDAEYDDNIYLLSDSKKAKLASPSTSDAISGHYAEMPKAGDLITTVHAEVEARGPGLMGRQLTIAPEAKYEFYAWNAGRRTEQLGITIAQALPHGARFRLKADMTPSTFFKNYLADARDADNDGSIDPNERIYAPGAYAEREISADYRFRLAKLTASRPLGVSFQVGGGYYGRSYDEPFSARDMSGPSASLGLMLEYRNGAELDVDYDVASLGATPTPVVMLLDESQFGVDFNANGSTSDVNARAVETVDHSRTEHGASVTLRVPAGRRVDVRLDYGHRWRYFGSAQQYDVSNNGRRDSRNEFGAALAVKVARSLRLDAAVLAQSQSLNRANDPAGLGDVADYTRHRISVGLTYAY